MPWRGRCTGFIPWLSVGYTPQGESWIFMDLNRLRRVHGFQHASASRAAREEPLDAHGEIERKDYQQCDGHSQAITDGGDYSVHRSNPRTSSKPAQFSPRNAAKIYGKSINASYGVLTPVPRRAAMRGEAQSVIDRVANANAKGIARPDGPIWAGHGGCDGRGCRRARLISPVGTGLTARQQNTKHETRK